MIKENQWESYSKRIVEFAPDTYGVYLLSDKKGCVVYIGRGKIKDSLNSHLEGGSNPLSNVTKFCFKSSINYEKAEQEQKHLLLSYKSTNYNYPIYNRE